MYWRNIDVVLRLSFREFGEGALTNMTSVRLLG